MRIGEFVSVRPGDRHVADAETVEVAEHPHVIFDGVAAFDTQERRELVLAVGALDVGSAEGHHHTVGMTGGLFVNRIDEVESMAGEVALIGFGLDPNGEELRAEIASPGLVEANVAYVLGVLGADVIVLVEEALRGVGVGIDDNGGVVDLVGLSADRLGADW
jgi:hypothetical protein